MRKRSISDQCLVKHNLVYNFKQNLNRAKSEEKLKINKIVTKQGQSKRKQFLNFVKPASLFRFKKDKSKIEHPIILTTINENEAVTVKFPKKKSIVLQAGDFLNADNYPDLNGKLEVLKISMMNNLNRLIERDHSLMDLEKKADSLNCDALNLKMTSNNIKKLKAYKKLRNRIFFCLIVLVIILIFYSAFIFWFNYTRPKSKS
ncbi:unnamed protein product [Brachionus calyciflorus]|uniref:V-SNARE coiled-coil homology domain-containing protein n=1 Tax=Brachionus calyciflorus TaxID=104777 RepID=A0A813T4P4_9BILA|nr:unnamed protein product [Brachionus calyciflorus]